MAADSDGDLIETVVTCEGDLGDPDFPRKFQVIVNRLSSLVCKGKTNIFFSQFVKKKKEKKTPRIITFKKHTLCSPVISEYFCYVNITENIFIFFTPKKSDSIFFSVQFFILKLKYLFL